MSTFWRLNFEMVPRAWKVGAPLVQLKKLSEIKEFSFNCSSLLVTLQETNNLMEQIHATVCVFQLPLNMTLSGFRRPTECFGTGQSDSYLARENGHSVQL